MNSCLDGDVRDVLPELVNGSLSGDAKARVEQHITVCAECAAEVELLRTARAALRFAPAMDVNRIAGAIQSAGAERMVARRAWRSPARLLAVAAAAAVVAIIAVSRDGSIAERVVIAEPAAGVLSIDSNGLAGPAPAVVQVPAREVAAPAPDERLLALGTDVGALAEDQLLALLESVSELDALPSEDPLSVEVESINEESQS